MKRFYLLLGALALVGVLVVGYTLTSRSTAGAATTPVTVEGLDDPTTLLALAQGMVLGDPDADVTIYEFGDYQCPGCGGFALQVKPLLDRAYVDEGRAKFVFYDFPLVSIHPNAFLAARAGRCAVDQGLFWEYHAKLFETQPRWANSAAPLGQYVDYAEEVGMDKGEFESCLRSEKYADVVTANMRLGEDLGVTGTPTVMVSRGNGMAQRVGNSFEAISQAVEGLLTAAEVEETQP